MSPNSYQELLKSSHLSAGNFEYIDHLFESFLENPNNVPDVWKRYFESIADGRTDTQHGPIRDYFRNYVPQKQTSGT